MAWAVLRCCHFLLHRNHCMLQLRLSSAPVFPSDRLRFSYFVIGGLPLSFLIGCCSTSKRLRWRSAASEIHCFRRSTASEIPGDRILGGQPLLEFIVFGGLPLLNFIEWAVFRCKVAHAQRRPKIHLLRIHTTNECVWTARGEWLPPQRRTAHAKQTDCEAGDRPE